MCNFGRQNAKYRPNVTKQQQMGHEYSNNVIIYFSQEVKKG
jgi:hypothetical protein